MHTKILIFLKMYFDTRLIIFFKVYITEEREVTVGSCSPEMYLIFSNVFFPQYYQNIFGAFQNDYIAKKKQIQLSIQVDFHSI